MAGRLTRGEIWLYRFKVPDKRRPVVVLTRADVIHLLRDVMVAPVSSTIADAWIPAPKVVSASNNDTLAFKEFRRIEVWVRTASQELFDLIGSGDFCARHSLGPASNDIELER